MGASPLWRKRCGMGPLKAISGMENVDITIEQHSLFLGKLFFNSLYILRIYIYLMRCLPGRTPGKAGHLDSSSGRVDGRDRLIVIPRQEGRQTHSLPSTRSLFSRHRMVEMIGEMKTGWVRMKIGGRCIRIFPVQNTQ